MDFSAESISPFNDDPNDMGVFTVRQPRAYLEGCHIHRSSTVCWMDLHIFLPKQKGLATNMGLSENYGKVRFQRLPSGKRLQNCGKSHPFLMGKLTINCHFQ